MGRICKKPLARLLLRWMVTAMIVTALSGCSELVPPGEGTPTVREERSLPKLTLADITAATVSSYDPPDPVKLSAEDRPTLLAPVIDAWNKVRHVSKRDVAMTPDYRVELTLVSGDKIKLAVADKVLSHRVV